MDTTYSPEAIECSWYERWEHEQFFKPQGMHPFCVMLPPPNVTGSLHMGHGFQHTLMDILVRYHRMLQDKTLWQPGTDHAGISTQLVVERQLEAQGISRKDLSRSEFLDKVWAWKETSGNQITQQMRRLGSSVDWSRERFTMDEGLSKAVHKVFVQLYDEGLIYRGTRLVNWDPKLSTAVSDLEVLTSEEDGFLWHIRYDVVDSSESLVIATTRPETLLGDVAIAVHPDDTRYQHLIGQSVHLPLCQRIIPIIADDYVDKEFGTGCVKITPAHDFNDHAIGKRHGLPVINILTKKATINKNAPAQYQGMDRFVAREHILADLKASQLLVDTKPHKLNIPRGEKSNAIIEPLLTDQWYVSVKPLAQPAIEAVKDGRVRFVPENWTKTYFQWMENIEDWCISRQLWWGHRIPAWYDNQNRVYVGHSENDVRFKYNLDANVVLHQDEDVLDTWFSSALWPFSTLGWPEKTVEFETFYPTSVLVTGFDIIFFWVARMIMMTLHFRGEVPFKEVYVHGLIRDAKGEKMSKTKGNGIDPLDVIDGISLDDLIAKRTQNLTQPRMAEAITKATQKEYPNGIRNYGSDALRFTFCAYASPGRNINFDLSRVEGYHYFCNKLWNASRFVLMNVNSIGESRGDNQSLADRWIVSRMRQLIIDAHEAVSSYRFDLYANVVYEFIWHEFCDWYVELTKSVFFDPAAESREVEAASSTLITVLEMLLRVAHPIMPYITDTLWREIAPLAGITAKTLMLQPFPQMQDAGLDEEADIAINWLKEVITAVRNIRGERGVKPSQEVVLMLQGGTPRDKQLSKTTAKLLQRQAKLRDEIVWLDPDDPVPASSVQLVHHLKVIVPFTDPDESKAEQQRLASEINKKQKTLDKLDSKLGNPNFIEKAPADVVAKEQARLDELSSQIETLRQQQFALDKIIGDTTTT